MRCAAGDRLGVVLQRRRLLEPRLLSSAASHWQHGRRRGLATVADAIPQQDEAIPRNPVGVQLLPSTIRRQIFANTPFPPPSKDAVEISQAHLRKHDLATKLSAPIPAPAMDLPPLQGETIDEHFHRIGIDRAEPWLGLSQTFARKKLPPMPTNWNEAPGWTMYHPDGSFEEVAAPPDRALVFDVETLPATTQRAVLAVAASDRNWYSWISPWLLGESDEPDQLVPMPGDSARLVVGHNVGFDRARIREEYDLEATRTRFLDTMSLHIACYGLSNPQRPAYLSVQKIRKAKRAAALANGDALPEEPPTGDASWTDVASMNSLDEVARLHCGIEVDKSIRDAFLEWDKPDVVDNLPRLMDYCATDVLSTHAVFAKLLPEFLDQCPNPVSFAGMLLMGNPFLPVDETWERFLQRADDTYSAMLKGVRTNLLKLAEATRKLMFVENKETGRMIWEDDHWLRQLDWSPKKARWASVDAPEELQDVRLKEGPPSQAVVVDPSPKAALAPIWFVELRDPVDGALQITHTAPVAALLLRVSYRGCPVVWSKRHGWLVAVRQGTDVELEGAKEVPRSELPSRFSIAAGERFFTIPSPTRVRSLLAKKTCSLFEDGTLTTPHLDEAVAACRFAREPDCQDADVSLVYGKLGQLATEARDMPVEVAMRDPWLRQLDWTLEPDEGPLKACPDAVKAVSASTFERAVHRRRLGERSASTLATKAKAEANDELIWPYWYWHLTRGGVDKVNLTTKSQLTPLLLRLSYYGHPLYRSRQHGWVFRIEPRHLTEPWLSRPPLAFTTGKDELIENDDALFFKLPHPAGEEENVGSPLAKAFDKTFEDGTLRATPLVIDGTRYDSCGTASVDSGALSDNAKQALSMNLQCSYWLNASQRVKEQMVVWRSEEDVVAPGSTSPLDRGEHRKQGLILPQVTVMGTVTRRATEKTWLAAANAKSNKIGTELKSMVRAPPGYAIVGADVDSEELWICSVMGDAQFGMHGATAIGWMTLEGSKSQGTDLHSKTASILGVSRNDAKIFNYSRLYGAGVTHAVQLLLKADPKVSRESARRSARALYMATKGNKLSRQDCFGRKFWYGGTESYVFNKLEQIALADDPKTPTLGCGITRALRRKHLPAEGAGQDFMTSRVNWAVQSSGVDYLHMLVVAMDYLVDRFAIRARYMISVHDEIRYLSTHEDRYRTSAALQISNLWTRCMFAYTLQMDDLPQSCAWFSAVDVDHVLRKEVDLPCTTPSNPDPIPPGETLDIVALLAKLADHVLGPPVKDLAAAPDRPFVPRKLDHRSSDVAWLEAQAAGDAKTVRSIWQESKAWRPPPPRTAQPRARAATYRDVHDAWAALDAR